MAAGSCTVEVAEPLDIAEVDRVRSALASAVCRAVTGARRVVLDLEDCDFVDAVGHAMLTDLVRTAEQYGVTLQVVGASDGVLRLLSILDAVLVGDVRAHVVTPARAAPTRTSSTAPRRTLQTSDKPTGPPSGLGARAGP